MTHEVNDGTLVIRGNTLLQAADGDNGVAKMASH